jgi:hypothetical protein
MPCSGERGRRDRLGSAAVGPARRQDRSTAPAAPDRLGAQGHQRALISPKVPGQGSRARQVCEHMLGSREVIEMVRPGAHVLASAIDALLTLDPDTLDDAELADVVVGLQRQQARLAAATTRLTAEMDARRVWADDGSRSCGAWLALRFSFNPTPMVRSRPTSPSNASLRRRPVVRSTALWRPAPASWEWRTSPTSARLRPHH